MSFLLRLFIVLLLTAVASPAAENTYPDAGDLIAGVLAALPDIPVRVTAQLQSRNEDGDVEKTLNAEMRLDWHGAVPSAKYSIRDAFGANLEGLIISWQADGTPQFRYFRGDPLVIASLPNLSASIAGTDICWIDLTLSYLWWPGGKTTGSETIRGRFCYIVEIPAPPRKSGTYAGVRLWIDPQLHILLKAESYDSRNNPLRLLEVKSFKKVNDLWLIQNIDIQTLSTRHKTVLRVTKADSETGN